MTRKTYCLLAGIIFSLVALMHLLRLLQGWNAVIGAWEVPMWGSIIGLAVASVLAFFGLRFGTRDQ